MVDVDDRLHESRGSCPGPAARRVFDHQPVPSLSRTFVDNGRCRGDQIQIVPRSRRSCTISRCKHAKEAATNQPRPARVSRFVVQLAESLSFNFSSASREGVVVVRTPSDRDRQTPAAVPGGSPARPCPPCGFPVSSVAHRGTIDFFDAGDDEPGPRRYRVPSVEPFGRETPTFSTWCSRPGTSRASCPSADRAVHHANSDHPDVGESNQESMINACSACGPTAGREFANQRLQQVGDPRPVLAPACSARLP